MSNNPHSQTEVDSKTIFAELFGPIMPFIRKTKRTAHFISLITQGFAIYQIAQSSISGLGKTTLMITSIIIAIVVGIVIEGGISKIFPIWARQVCRWKFENKWFLIMFVVITVMVFPLLIFSPILSGSGAQEGIERIIPIVQKESSQELESLYAARIDSLDNKYQDLILMSEKDHEKLIKSIQSKYERKININDAIYNKHKTLYQNGSDWAKSHMDKAVIANRKLRADRDDEISNIENEKLNESKKLRSSLEIARTDITDDKKRNIKDIDSKYKKADTARTTTTTKWGGLGGFLAVFCSIVVALCIIINEVYRAGGGQDYTKTVDLEKQSKLDQLFAAIDNQFDNVFDGLIKGVTHGVKIVGDGSVRNDLIPLPSIVLNEPKQVKQENETSETTPNKPAETTKNETAESLVQQELQPVSEKYETTNETIVFVNQSPRYIKQCYTQAFRRSEKQRDPTTPLKNMDKYGAMLIGMGIKPILTGDENNPVDFKNIVP